MIGVPRLITVLTTSLIGATIVMTQTAAAGPDAASDSQIDRRVRTFRADLDKDSSPFFWDLLPGPQVRAISTGLQAKTPVDLSGVTIAEKTITEHGRNIKLYVVKQCAPRWPFDTGRAPPGQRGTQEVLAALGPCSWRGLI